MGFLAALAPVLGAVGTGISVLGTIQQGSQARAQAEYQAKVQSMQADETKAASQRDAAAQYRQGAYLASQQRAAIAGSGGSLADASVLDLMGDTAAETDLAARTEIYKGEQQMRGLNDAAKNSIISGRNAQTASYIAAAGSLFSGVSSMYSRFGQQAKSVAPATSSNKVYG